MSALYDTNAPKKPTSLTVNSDLLEKAKNLKINISSTLEAALIESLKSKEREKWLEENKRAIDGYNKSIAEYGLFSDDVRAI